MHMNLWQTKRMGVVATKNLLVAWLSRYGPFKRLRTSGVRGKRKRKSCGLGAEHAKLCHSKELLPPDMTAREKVAIKTVTINV